MIITLKMMMDDSGSNDNDVNDAYDKNDDFDNDENGCHDNNH